MQSALLLLIAGFSIVLAAGCLSKALSGLLKNGSGFGDAIAAALALSIAGWAFKSYWLLP